MQKEYPVVSSVAGLCVPACLRSILLTKKMDFSIEKIAKDLGIEIPKKYTEKYPDLKINKQNIFKQPINEEKYSINNFFKKNGIPFKMKLVYTKDTTKLKEILKKHFHKADIAVCYDFPTSTNKPGKLGHIAIISKLDKNTLELSHPSNINKNIVSYVKLTKAIQTHSKKKMAGIWIFKKDK